MRVVIAGGGTAGHVNPALALAACIDGDISFVGTSSGAETTRTCASRPLPMSLRVAVEKLGVPQSYASFAVPLGSKTTSLTTP